jgi:co-chaperonin GroES (HSP10)
MDETFEGVTTPDEAPPTQRRRGLVIGILGAVAGCAAGAVIAGSLAANAATAGSGTATGSAVASQQAPPPPCLPGARHAPPLTGTVTAVGSSSVTIKTSSGTKRYSVTSSSDIDKNGEAKLSDLKVGDAVRFDTLPGTSTIGHLHAGNEALDRPSGAH